MEYSQREAPQNALGYASRLSVNADRGPLGHPEIWDAPATVEEKTQLLAEWIKKSSCVVIHTGAGISTNCGIADFRGPKGVWTLEDQGVNLKKFDVRTSPVSSPTGSTESHEERAGDNGDDLEEDDAATASVVGFQEAQPSLTHRFITHLVSHGLAHFVISQNVDGLHLRSGLPFNCLSEVHGNLFVERCDLCRRRFSRQFVIPTIGFKQSGHLSHICGDIPPPPSAVCRDVLLDWFDAYEDFFRRRSLAVARKADLHLCLGTSLHMDPAGSWPLEAKKGKRRNKIAIVNLQKTAHHDLADLTIHSDVDKVSLGLLTALHLPDLTLQCPTCTIFVLRLPRFSPLPSTETPCCSFHHSGNSSAAARRRGNSTVGSLRRQRSAAVSSSFGRSGQSRRASDDALDDSTLRWRPRKRRRHGDVVDAEDKTELPLDCQDDMLNSSLDSQTINTSAKQELDARAGYHGQRRAIAERRPSDEDKRNEEVSSNWGEPSSRNINFRILSSKLSESSLLVEKQKTGAGVEENDPCPGDRAPDEALDCGSISRVSAVLRGEGRQQVYVLRCAFLRSLTQEDRSTDASIECVDPQRGVWRVTLFLKGAMLMGRFIGGESKMIYFPYGAANGDRSSSPAGEGRSRSQCAAAEGLTLDVWEMSLRTLRPPPIRDSSKKHEGRFSGAGDFRRIGRMRFCCRLPNRSNSPRGFEERLAKQLVIPGVQQRDAELTDCEWRKDDILYAVEEEVKGERATPEEPTTDDDAVVSVNVPNQLAVLVSAFCHVSTIPVDAKNLMRVSQAHAQGGSVSTASSFGTSRLLRCIGPVDHFVNAGNTARLTFTIRKDVLGQLFESVPKDMTVGVKRRQPRREDVCGILSKTLVWSALCRLPGDAHSAAVHFDAGAHVTAEEWVREETSEEKSIVGIRVGDNSCRQNGQREGNDGDSCYVDCDSVDGSPPRLVEAVDPVRQLSVERTSSVCECESWGGGMASLVWVPQKLQGMFSSLPLWVLGWASDVVECL